MSKKDLFEEMGLEVKAASVEVGKNYPIYGMITEILDESGPDLKCIVNFNMLLTLYGVPNEKLETLKLKAFEPGIFITKITKVADDLEEGPYNFEGECSTVIFGKSPESEII